MQTRKEHIEAIWNKMLSNEATPEELDRLLKEIDSSGDTPEEWHFIAAGFASENEDQPGFTAMDADQKQQLLQQWQRAAGSASTTEANKPRAINWRRWMQVAAVIAILTTSIVLLRQQRSKTASSDQSHIASVPAINPGKNGAILTLANGQELVLDSAGNGVIATENGANIVLEDGFLEYKATGNSSSTTEYNTMYTPRGRQFRITLPDGTQVWLNSASTIRFPTAFSPKERRVSINGEAYFEVAPNAHSPFLIDIAGKAGIEVLGTSFNINAYDNGKALQATLVEGSIRIVAGQERAQSSQKGIIIKPGQQAVIGNASSTSGASGITIINNADIDKIVAWKNGLFNFHGLGLAEAMQQLERWYDIEVIYENGIPEIPFDGEISRNVSLEKLLKMLADADLTFRIEKNRKLIITK
ncbi:FecR family protein [Filimonas effusa]|uniref:DUF4974 domain-containing protein n=1 Tax=Filimonas effusa TaxID=2508721 RepID=A0A4V1MAU2_9BACT|nr:FecR domain-containing protein [Filimonas effusa]RXK87066.1 DUF4974 domain-containing protein [Filimonas effusa]